MEMWTEVRRRVLNKELSKRAACKEYSIHWDTLTKILEHVEPPGYQQAQPRPKPKIGPFLPIIHKILKEDRQAPRKQRHTAKRIFDRLVAEHQFDGGYTIVKDAVRAWRQQTKEVFLPLSHPRGEAQVDFGFAQVDLDGIREKVALFVMTLPYSDALFIQAFPRECTESFQEGHRRAFEFFGGVPRRISYDNSKIAVAKILGSRKRKITSEFLRLQSHYLFEHHFCLVRRPNEKGHVEHLLDFARNNYLVPVPKVDSLAELNERLAERCRADLDRQLRGKSKTKAKLLLEESSRCCHCPSKHSTRDASRRPWPTRSRWCVSTPTAIACRPSTPIARLRSSRRSTRCGWYPKTASSLGILVIGDASSTSSTRSTTWLCWRRSQADWIMPGRWKIGICQSALTSCAGVWSERISMAWAHASSSACYDCWNTLPSSSWPARSSMPWTSASRMSTAFG